MPFKLSPTPWIDAWISSNTDVSPKPSKNPCLKSSANPLTLAKILSKTVLVSAASSGNVPMSN